MEKKSPVSRTESVDIIRATTRRLVAPFSSPNRRRSSSVPMQAPVATKGHPSSESSAVLDGRQRSDRMPMSSPTGEITSPMTELAAQARSSDIAAALASSSNGASASGGGGGGDKQLFEGLTYCGHCTVDAPISQTEANRAMNMLRKQPQESMSVLVSVPVTSDGSVRLIDRDSGLELTNYPIRSVLFCARGTRENNARDCMAFTVAHRQGSGVFYCHVLKADEEDKIRRMLRLLGTAFKHNTQRQRVLAATEGRLKTLDFKFQFFIDIGEEDSKGQYICVARDKDLFKLRQSIPKQIGLILAQTQEVPLVLQRCFGVLIAAGRDVSQAQMHPIDNVQMKAADDGKSYYITGQWDPADPNHASLNQETPKGDKLSLTIAADLVFAGIAEPVRFVRQIKVRVFRKNERFWISTRHPSMETFHMRLKETTPFSASPCDEVDAAAAVASASRLHGERTHYEVDSLEIVDEDRTPHSSLSDVIGGSTSGAGAGGPSHSGSTSPSPAGQTTAAGQSDKRLDLSVPTSGAVKRARSMDDVSCSGDLSDSDEHDGPVEDDEPLASGSGIVDRHWAAAELENWSDLLSRWDGTGRPKQLTTLIRKGGVPEPLRGRVWEMLAGLTADSDLLDNFRVLVTKESPQERIILEDINRTYPAHEYFREDGEGQRALYKISKAYSIYDKEVGYCQGLSFLIAALVLHMPMEQAFGCLVQLMYQYEVRDLFRNEFTRLKLNLFQLQKLLEDAMPDLAQHLAAESVETHMFASQWFLTLYSSKFPLHAVYRILDLFLSEGSDVIFQVGIALLKIAKAELLALDFEGILKYFRVQLPKKFSTEEQAARLLRQVVSTKISQRKLKKFSKDYVAHLEAEALNCDPVERLKRLTSEQHNTIHRLEQENDNLATELVASKVHLRTEMDELERKVDRLSKQLRNRDDDVQRVTMEKEQTCEEFSQFKELYQQSLLELNELRERTSSERAEQSMLAREMDERHQRVQHDLQQELLEVKARLSKVMSRRQQASSTRSHGEASTSSGVGDSDQRTTSQLRQPIAENKADSSADPSAAATAAASEDESVPVSGDAEKGSEWNNGEEALEIVDDLSLSAEHRCRDLEVQMAHYKLQLVEAECKIQDLQHALRTSTPDQEQESTVNRWLSKLR
eukprot:scpid28342/ scgid26743/ Rab GTPase-activating protein 1; GAP and centrosome-associated protein; Rab6 GTPase-activating protein GAPCenA